jgi:hypothetical protein
MFFHHNQPSLPPHDTWYLLAHNLVCGETYSIDNGSQSSAKQEQAHPVISVEPDSQGSHSVITLSVDGILPR